MSTVSLRIHPAQYQQMIAHAEAVYPLESCGIVAGSDGEAARVYPIDNILQSPTAFEMAPKQQLEAMLEIEAHGLEMVAIYHSHPQGPQTPSATDVAQAYYPDSIQLIISLQEPKRPVTRAFTIMDGQVDEVPLIIE